MICVSWSNPSFVSTMVATTVAGLATIGIVFTHVNEIAGWTFRELFFFYALSIIGMNLSDLPHYQRHLFIHEVLVPGYDAENRTFVLSGFDEQGGYAVSRVPFAVMGWVCSFTRKGHIQQALQADRPLSAWFLPSMEGRPRMFLYKYLPDQPYVFDPCAVAEQLADYLFSSNANWKTRPSTATSRGASCGSTKRICRRDCSIWRAISTRRSSLGCALVRSSERRAVCA